MGVRFLQGDIADVADTLGGAVDALFFGNAIHLVHDKDQALRKIAGVLVPGGVFAFNKLVLRGRVPTGHREVLPALDAARDALAAS